MNEGTESGHGAATLERLAGRLSDKVIFEQRPQCSEGRLPAATSSSASVWEELCRQKEQECAGCNTQLPMGPPLWAGRLSEVSPMLKVLWRGPEFGVSPKFVIHSARGRSQDIDQSHSSDGGGEGEAGLGIPLPAGVRHLSSLAVPVAQALACVQGQRSIPRSLSFYTKVGDIELSSAYGLVSLTHCLIYTSASSPRVKFWNFSDDAYTRQETLENHRLAKRRKLRNPTTQEWMAHPSQDIWCLLSAPLLTCVYAAVPGLVKVTVYLKGSEVGNSKPVF